MRSHNSFPGPASPPETKTNEFMSKTPRTSALAASIDPATLEHDAYATAINHAIGLERELIEMRTESARLITAVNDAIRRPLGVVPASAEEFYTP